MNKIVSKVELAYIAGIIDGEGCIHINKRKQKLGRNDDFAIEITIVNTSKKLMEWLWDKLGGYLNFRKSKNSKWKGCYRLRVSRLQAEILLKRLLPYLIAKKSQAEIVLELRKHIKLGKTQRLSEKELERREFLYLKIKRFNKRGLIPVIDTSQQGELEE